jgi:quercetin dioxygenase-like cupin family protein
LSANQIVQGKKIDKPWGYEILWALTKDYVGKVLFVRAGESLSLQYHNTKEETLFLESGECLLETGPNGENLTSLIMVPGSVFHITPGTWHRLEAKTDCRFFEVSTNHLDDVVRVKDRYGRN